MSSTSDRYSAAISTLLDRLEDAIDAEMLALGDLQTGGFDIFCRQKSRILLELSRLVRVAGVEPLNPILASRLDIVRAKLERDQSLLGIHLTAAKEIAEIIANSLREADSDGTYSAPFASTEAQG